MSAVGRRELVRGILDARSVRVANANEASGIARAAVIHASPAVALWRAVLDARADFAMARRSR
jgi:hypothetical protein